MAIVTVADGNPFGEYVRRNSTTALKGLGGFGEWEGLYPIAVVYEALLFNVPGLIAGGVAAILGYPKTAAGAVVAGDVLGQFVIAPSMGVHLSEVPPQAFGYGPTSYWAINGIVTLVAATGLYFLGRWRERAKGGK